MSTNPIKRTGWPQRHTKEYFSVLSDKSLFLTGHPPSDWVFTTSRFVDLVLWPHFTRFSRPFVQKEAGQKTEEEKLGSFYDSILPAFVWGQSPNKVLAGPRSRGRPKYWAHSSFRFAFEKYAERKKSLLFLFFTKINCYRRKAIVRIADRGRGPVRVALFYSEERDVC